MAPLPSTLIIISGQLWILSRVIYERDPEPFLVYQGLKQVPLEIYNKTNLNVNAEASPPISLKLKFSSPVLFFHLKKKQIKETFSKNNYMPMYHTELYLHKYLLLYHLYNYIYVIIIYTLIHSLMFLFKHIKLLFSF